MMDSVEQALQELREVLQGVDYDQALFFEHASDDAQGGCQALCRLRFAMQRDGSLSWWSLRWFPRLDASEAWLRSDTPWTDDLEAIANDEFEDTGRPISELDGVADLRQDHLRGLVGVGFPAIGDIEASLVLASEQPGRYGAAERDFLRTPAVGRAIGRILDRLLERRRNTIRKLRRCFVPGVSPEEVAQSLVRILAEDNEWDYVGVYRVDTQFSLVATWDRTPDGVLQMDPTYRQDLNDGMLGETLREGRCLRADDVAVDPPPFNYIKPDHFEARSALCYPVKVSGNVEWILDCASRDISAFRGPDGEVLDKTVKELQTTLDLWFETRLSAAMLDSLSEPVLVADRQGYIRRVNAAARDRFGDEIAEPGRHLAELGHDGESRRLLDDLSLLVDHELVLRAPSGPPMRMLATVRRVANSFGQFVVRFASRDGEAWQASLEVARQTVQGDAAQARVLLMLASSLLGRMRADLRQGRTDRMTESLDRTEEALQNAAMDYERLAGGMAGQSRHVEELMNACREIGAPAALAPALFESVLTPEAIRRLQVQLVPPAATLLSPWLASAEPKIEWLSQRPEETP